MTKIVILLVSVITFSQNLLAETYISEVWLLQHGNGTKECVLDTSVCLEGSIGLYIVDNNISYKKYVYAKINPAGNIVKFETADTMDEIIGKQNDNAIGNKKMKKFIYMGNGKSFQAMHKDWKEGKDLQ